MELQQAQELAKEFSAARAWDLNMPTQRGAHLMREVARLTEHTLYMEGMTIKEPPHDLEKQVGDVLFSLFAFANRLGIDVETQYERALKADAAKYPAEATKRASLARLKECSTTWPTGK